MTGFLFSFWTLTLPESMMHVWFWFCLPWLTTVILIVSFVYMLWFELVIYIGISISSIHFFHELFNDNRRPSKEVTSQCGFDSRYQGTWNTSPNNLPRLSTSRKWMEYLRTGGRNPVLVSDVCAYLGDVIFDPGYFILLVLFFAFNSCLLYFAFHSG